MKTRFLAALAGLFLSFSAATIDRYPSKPVKLIVAYSEGSGADELPQLVAGQLSEVWKQSVVVEKKPEASGNAGMALGARSAPDGYTLVLVRTGDLALTPLVSRRLSFDAEKDLTPITILASSPTLLVAHPSIPAKTLTELIRYAKANPGKLSFASLGEGSNAHLAGELLNLRAGIKSRHVPYKEMAPALDNLLAGNVQLMFAPLSAVLEQVQAGKLVAIAVAGPSRIRAIPDVATVYESEIPDLDMMTRYGLVVRSGTPGEVIGKIQVDVRNVLSREQTFVQLRDLGLSPIATRPEDFARLVRHEREKFIEVVREANIKLPE